MNNTTMKLQQALNCDLTNYGPIPFWSWNNELDENELIKQIEDMHRAGMGGFIMHARIGLKTEYLGEKWFSCIEACLKKARELHMNAWIYDENGWPSGFVGGKLLEKEEYRAQFLEYKCLDFVDRDAFCVYIRKNGDFVRIDGECDGVKEYHNVYLRTSPANTDILNPEVVDAFIDMTHEEYYRRFPQSFGRELAGFFTDEPQCYRWATSYSRFVEEPFFQKYGEDVRDGLIYLFLHDERGYTFRTRFYSLMQELYVKTFYKRIYDWCTEHNCKLTGHSIEENSLSGQMLGGFGVSATYEYEHIPGIDWLGRIASKELGPKQIGSVASQLGIKQVLTETFACCGYNVTPKELKNVAEFQYFSGVNLMCHHLFPYSIAAQGKSDHPPVFSKHSNWFEQLGEFNRYFTRLGYLIANTRETYDVLIIHPLRNVYLDYVKGDSGEYTKYLEQSFAALLATLRKNGVRYQFADETILAKYGSARGNTLSIGKCEYTTVIVPDMLSIASETLELLRAYNGKLLCVGMPKLVDGIKKDVCLTSNITLDDVLANADVKFYCEDGCTEITTRRSELGEYIFVKNTSQTEPSKFSTKGVADRYSALDLDTYALSSISDEMTLEPYGSMILVRDENAVAKKAVYSCFDVTDAFKVTSITENALILDYACLAHSDKIYGERLPIQRIFEDLLRLDKKERIYLRQSFKMAEALPVKLLIEKGRWIDPTLNGKPLTLTQSDFDVNFLEADLTDKVIAGENVLEYGVDYYQHDGVHFALFDPLATESVRNCLYYDTHIESCYICGDFIVDAEHVIRPRTALPALTSDLKDCGYPFFKGTLTLEGKVYFDGKDERMLSLDGAFLVAELYINGERTDLITDNKKEITNLLKIGENDVKIVLHSSLRNFFGPHHYLPEPEPIWLSPVTFTLRGSWNGGIAEEYTHTYNSVPFGVDRVTVITERYEY